MRKKKSTVMLGDPRFMTKKKSTMHFLADNTRRDRRGAQFTPCGRIGSVYLGDSRLSDAVVVSNKPEDVLCQECLAVLAKRTGGQTKCWQTAVLVVVLAVALAITRRRACRAVEREQMAARLNQLALWGSYRAFNREAMGVSSPPAPVADRAPSAASPSVAERVSMRDWGHFCPKASRCGAAGTSEGMKPKRAFDKFAGRLSERFLLFAIVVVIAVAVFHLRFC
jgi:hypothetical protein